MNEAILAEECDYRKFELLLLLCVFDKLEVRAMFGLWLSHDRLRYQARRKRLLNDMETASPVLHMPDFGNTFGNFGMATAWMLDQCPRSSLLASPFSASFLADFLRPRHIGSSAAYHDNRDVKTTASTDVYQAVSAQYAKSSGVHHICDTANTFRRPVSKAVAFDDQDKTDTCRDRARRHNPDSSCSVRRNTRNQSAQM